MNLDIGGTLSYTVFALVVPLLFSLSFVVFVWGALQYIIAGGHDEEAREKGKSLILYGLIIFLVMFLLWSIGTFVVNTLPLG